MARAESLLAPTLLCLLPTAPAAAQELAPLVLSLPASTEALSLGNVFPVSGADPDAVFYNPAALARAAGIGAAGQRFGANSSLLNLSGAHAWFDGTVGIGASALSYDGASATTPPGPDDLMTDGSVGVSELAVSVGYARDLGAFALGAAGKLVETRIADRRGGAAAFDLGATTDVAFLTVGLAVQNIGSDIGVGDQELGLPERVTVSGSFEPEPVGPLDVRAAAAVTRRGDGELVPAGGVDIRYWPIQGRTFVARVGLQRVPDGPARPLTIGLAFWGDELTLEYAFQAFEGPGDAHRVGLRWRPD